VSWLDIYGAVILTDIYVEGGLVQIYTDLNLAILGELGAQQTTTPLSTDFLCSKVDASVAEQYQYWLLSIPRALRLSGKLQENLEPKLCDTRVDIVSTYQPQQKILEWPRTLSPREYSI
jgi:hypothetical protein